MAMRTETAASATSEVPPATGRVPPLENGDRLTRAEFERRYDAMPNLKRAELIKGVVYMPSPVNHEKHASPHFDLIGWLGVYRMATPGVRGGDNGSLRLDLDNEPQPDAYLLIHPTHGGQASIDAEGYVAGAPELVAEVAASSVSYDLHDKLEIYRDHGALEYVIWRVPDEAIDWFILRGDRYEPLPLDADGLYKSEVLPGLWLNPIALVRGDLISAVQTLQQGVASPEHAAFVARLQQAKE